MPAAETESPVLREVDDMNCLEGLAIFQLPLA